MGYSAPQVNYALFSDFECLKFDEQVSVCRLVFTVLGFGSRVTFFTKTFSQEELRFRTDDGHNSDLPFEVLNQKTSDEIKVVDLVTFACLLVIYVQLVNVFFFSEEN